MGLFSRLRGVFGKKWGLSRDNALLIYNAVFIPRICYAAKFWETAASYSRAILTRTTIQRTALLGISSAYNTTSNVALQVITGTLPLDLEVRYQATKAGTRLLPELEKTQHRTRKLQQLVEEWQARWDASSKGRITYKFFPSIDIRLKTPIWLNHHITQFLTGHGDFRSKLHGFRLKPDPYCSCGFGEETSEHLLFHCPRTSPHSNLLKAVVVRAGYPWLCQLDVLTKTRTIYSAFDKFATRALNKNL